MLISRMKLKFSDFLYTKNLTESLNPVECWFLYSERDFFYEELYGEEKSGRAEMAARGR